MTTETLTQQIKTAIKTAMKARDKELVSTLRLISAEFKRVEVDERIEVDDERALVILDKMVKQRKDSFTQFDAAGRTDLAAKEAAEIAIIQQYLPAQLTEGEIAAIIATAIAETGASSMKEMGQVMAIVKPQVQGRGDMGAASKLVKAQLG